MVGIGTLLALLGVLHLLTWFRRRRFVESRWFAWGVVAAGPLSVVALICGWVATEVGRQPWVVYHVMRTSQAVTGAGGIPVGYATLVVVYFALAFAVAWILLRLQRRPLDVAEQPPPILEAHGAR
jgi:cytochrome d ubiquinol oxidase subunit I